VKKSIDKQYSNKSKKVLAITLLIIVLYIIVSVCLGIYFLHDNEICTVKYFHDNENFVVQTYNKGEKLSFPETPVKVGYSFVGWALEKDDDNVLTQEIYVENELILYAKWKETMYKLTYGEQELYFTHNHTFLEQNNKLIIIGDNTALEISQPIQLGKIFVGWEIFDGKNYHSLEKFSFENLSTTNMELIPQFEDVIFDFVLPKSNYYTLSSLSHNESIKQCETLTFAIQLDDSVNMSTPRILSTSGDINVEYSNGVYKVEICNFSQDFEVKVEDVFINIYSVEFFSEGKQITENVKHGDSLPNVEFLRDGYTLVGFCDESNNRYSAGYIVTSDLVLEAIWEKNIYEIRFPKNNGIFALQLMIDTLSNDRVVYREHNQSVEFCVTLSKAYSQSEYVVYGVSGENKIYPKSFEPNVFVFNNIQCDMEIVIDNLSLNTYNVIIDGKNYGDVSYGSWIYIEDESIFVRDISTNIIIEAKAIIGGNNFNGWMLKDMVMTTCMVQDVSNGDGVVEILGNYTKSVARVTLIANGGTLNTSELIIVEGEEMNLPIPTRKGYVFVGWFTRLVEVNTQVDILSSQQFSGITKTSMVLYAGWSKISYY
jgi:uncharacterized repeat protein (TIGR02543 family)